MSSDDARPAFDEASYREYERKMIQFEEGPTTTYFEQLTTAGIELPEPDAVADCEIRTKLWEVLAGMAALRVRLDHTDHLSDRALYAKLWYEMLRQETPASDEIGFTSHVGLIPDGVEPDTSFYLRYYADDDERERWKKDDPDYDMPPHEDPLYDRDALLPCASYEVAEALTWLRANWSPSAVATNRFRETSGAIEFVEQLYAAGALCVSVDNVMMLPNHQWTPYADTLIVQPPDDLERRSAVFELMIHIGRPDEPNWRTMTDRGQAEVRLWWD